MITKSLEFKKLPRATLKGVYGPGDSKLWESTCGRYRIRYVRRAFGVRVEPLWHALFARSARSPQTASGCDPHWQLLSNHRTFLAAQKAIQKHAKEPKR